MAPTAHSADEALLSQCLRDSRLGFMERAADAAQQLIDGQGPGRSPHLRVDARIRLIWIQFQNGQHSEAGQTASAAIQEAIALRDPARESLARAYHARLLCEIDSVSDAADEVIAALRLARSVSDPLALSTALVVPAILCSRLGLYDACVEMADEAVKQARLSGDAEAIAHAMSNYGSLHADYLYRYAMVPPDTKRTYLDIAIAHSRLASDYARDQEDAEMQRLSGYNLVEFLLLAKDLEGAEAAMRATDAAIGTRSRRSEVQRGHVHAMLLLEQHDREGAITALRESVDRCLTYPFRELALFASERLSQALADGGDVEAAYREHKRFHTLFCEQNSEADSRHMQSSIILDHLAEMRRLIDTEWARAERLEALNRSLAQEKERLAKETLEDPLTGLANRRQLDLLFAALEADATRHAILLVDIDHFKQVNDRFSHVIGDVVLREVGVILRSVVMTEASPDLVARLGGEEFVIVVVTPHPGEAREICETLRQTIAEHDWSIISPGLAITASVGLAMSDEGANAAARMLLADERLYDAKYLGRNRSMFHDHFRAARLRVR
ncbi:GGDEF domain-containing protein [Acidisoma cladoniae]|uniref:GGDEF domain-containing protein n=1 Tax=Acidisoma cladoniae TaxID=3040935 RepID=UPI0025504465|nr:GGDEF domain-containing protein [Acidisoma sp. PAMC 29798]